MKLLALGMIGRRGIEVERQNLTSDGQAPGNRRAQILKQWRTNIADREQVNKVHEASLRRF
jgi:hypothetical protein